jgi:NodT family efflux transporter outer membrane factor (OMF) lipoprotein
MYNRGLETLSRQYIFLFVIIFCVTLLGCEVGPDYQYPEPPKTKAYTSMPLPMKSGEVKKGEEKSQEFVIQDHISRQWWILFNSEKLNQLIRRGLLRNPSLQAAQAALRQAEENLNAGIGGLLPNVNAQIGATRQKESATAFGLSSSPSTFNLYNASLNVSFQPDIFGALRRQVEALGAAVDNKRFELEATYLTLTANIVTMAIREASLRSQIQVTHDLILSQEKQLQILQTQFKAGSVSEIEVLTQETLVNQTKATLPPLATSLAQTRHTLATLIGNLPTEADIPSLYLTDIHLPAELPLTVPSSLIRHRPDIKAAEALLREANAQIGIAQGNMFPQLTLTGSVGDISNKYHNLFTSSSNVWSIASQLLQPIFQGGTLLAKEKAASAGYDKMFAQYRQTVLHAFQEVADVLHALVEDANRCKFLAKAEKSARHSLTISQKQYQLGAIAFSTLLTAERYYLQTSISRIQAEAARYADTAALFQALGGDCFALELEQQTQEINSKKSASKENAS